MTRTEAAVDVFGELENNNTYYSTTEVNDAIQDAYDEVALYAKTIEQQGEISLAANTGYYNLRSLFSNFYSPIGVFNELDGRWLTPTSTMKLDAMRLDWELMTGSPKWVFMASPEYLCVVPRPSASVGVLTLHYNACAPTLTDTTTIIVPEETKTIIPSYALMQMHEQAREFQKALDYEKDYEKDLRDTATFMARRASPDRMYTLWPFGQTL
jgi:hypothetical protein